MDGLCLEHYIESLLPRVAAFKPKAHVEPIIRFLAYSDRSGGPDACWPWLSTVHPKTGFGYIFEHPKLRTAHRFAYEHFVGPIPDGREVGHACCTDDCSTPGDGDPHRSCVNPRHVAICDAPQRYAYDCARCGAPVIRTRPAANGRAFCSMKCISGARMITKTCPVCGKDFTIARSNDGRYQTCSMACKNVDTVYINCKRCGKRFTDDVRQRWNRHYCSEACRRPPLMVACQNCGKEFRKSACDSTRFCSIPCVRQHVGETQLEARVRVALEALGVGFTQEYPFRRWSIDFAIPERKIAIEADGDYWHAILADRDARRDAAMNAAGWTVVRLAESDVNGAADLGQFILARLRAATGLELADVAGASIARSRRVRLKFNRGARGAIRPVKGQMALWD
jgi:very-short-patch-repair endonuclease/endogenous inhibitor of DNA gyrase (YacG/DUF329 family)